MMAIWTGAWAGLALGAAFCGGIAMAQDVDLGSVSRGGRLYDKWYAVVKAAAPTESHPLYPAVNEKYAADPASNWRCKECHGWDGLGAEGAYMDGSHATGIKGIQGMKGADPAAVMALLKAPEHGFGDKLSDADLMDLANFVVHGQVDWTPHIAAGVSTGDAAAGKQVFVTVCAGCHGPEGKLPQDMPPLGSLTDNPWEVMHKILNGQPAEAMPSLRAFDTVVAANLTAYLATLPAE